MKKLTVLLKEIRSCEACKAHLPLSPKPVLVAHPNARILIAGQAPGRRVHDSGIAWNDPSGDRLRTWMGIDKSVFYDERKIALIPMGFCYPGTGKSGDLPPRKECRELWHDQLLGLLPNLRLTLTVGQYANAYHLADRQKGNLTQTIQAWKSYGPNYFPLPHPSPRNNIWLKKNPWFEKEAIPSLRRTIRHLLPST